MDKMYRSLLIICTLSFAVFAMSLGGDFIMDEIPGFIESEKIRSIGHWTGYFATGLWDNSSLGIKDQFLYRPLVALYGSIMYHLFGGHPFMFHMMNVFLHAANSVMVFVLARVFFRSENTCLPICAALLFALHPVHVEAVAWIGGGVDVCMTFFFMLSFLFYVRYREDSRFVFFLISVILYVLALLYKETAITLPLLVLLYDFTEDKKVYGKRALLFLFITAIYFVVRTSVLGKALGTLTYSFQGVQNVLYLAVLDMKFLFFPWPAGYKFQMPDIGVSAGVASLAFIVLLVWAVRKNRKMLFPALWIVIPLAPPLLLAFYSRPIFGDRFLYLPSVGFVILVASLFNELYGKYKKETLIVFCSLLTLWGTTTVVSSYLWMDDKAVYSGAIRNSPKYLGAYEGLARYYEKKGQIDESLNTYLRAVENVEGKNRAEAYDNIAYLYGSRGYSEKSIFYYEKQLEIDPQSTDALIGLGNNYLSRKEYEKAINYYTGVLSLSGKDLLAYYNLAIAYEGVGNTGMAAFYYKKFIAEAPPGKYGTSIEHAQRALESFGKRR
jgi:hypothetical protein